MTTAHDRAITLFNRMVKRISRQEQARAAA